MQNSKPAMIKIGPCAKVGHLTATDNHLIGDADFVNNEGTLERATFERNQHTIPNEIAAQAMKRWFEKPFGIVSLSVVGAVLSAGLIYYFGWH